MSNAREQFFYIRFIEYKKISVSNAREQFFYIYSVSINPLLGLLATNSTFGFFLLSYASLNF